MSWLQLVKRDPVPWLLDPGNPSARALTLQHIFERPVASLDAERQAILAWEPVRALIVQCDPLNFWGRASDPYYGGPLGTFGTLYTLAQLGAPPFPQGQQACENLLTQGRQMSGRFAPADTTSAPWLCYTGMALTTLWHFGYGDDPRTRSAQAALIAAVLGGESLRCPFALSPCTWGLTKALRGLLSIPTTQRTPEEEEAITRLAETLVLHPHDFAGRDAVWLQLGFPRYYESDLVELAHALARTSFRTHPRFRELLQRVAALQTEEGRWRKVRVAPGLQVERPPHPSRWLTLEAVQAFILTYGGNSYAT